MSNEYSNMTPSLAVETQLRLAQSSHPEFKAEIQRLTRTTFMIFKENCTNPKQHFKKSKKMLQMKWNNPFCSANVS